MLTTEQKRLLGQDISKFLSWLKGRLPSASFKIYDYVIFEKPSESDWFMKVPPNPNEPVKFNTYALNSCSFAYYRMVVIHECFHLLVQNIPNKIDAKRLKDDHGDTFMLFLDIEADFYTYLFLREFYGYDLINIFYLNYEGREVFGGPIMRFPKLERFISAALTITNAFLLPELNEKTIYLCSSKNILTEEELHVLISKTTHFEAAQLRITESEFQGLTVCYKQEIENRGKYASTIIKICSSLLGLEIPARLKQELQKIEKE